MKIKAFTLVELLATITILAVIMVLVVPTALSMISSSKQHAYDLQVAKIISAAQDYTMDNKSSIVELRTVGSNYDVPLQLLADKGYLDVPILNPLTNSNFDANNTYVTIQKKKTGDYLYVLGKGSSIMTINGTSSDSVACAATGNYTDPGAVVNDPYLSAPTTIYATNTVALNSTGSHTINYVYTNEKGVSFKKTRTVTVYNSNSPTINIAGNVSFVSLTVGSAFTAPTATATDPCDGSLAVTVTSNVLPNTVGDYTATYTATNNGGTRTTKVITVRVLYATSYASFDSRTASVSYPLYFNLPAGTYTFKLTGGQGAGVAPSGYTPVAGGPGGTVIMSVILPNASNIQINKITNGDASYRTSFHIYVNGTLYAASGGGGDAATWNNFHLSGSGEYQPRAGGSGGGSTGGSNPYDVTYTESGSGAVGATGGAGGYGSSGDGQAAQNKGSDYPTSTGGVSSTANGGNGYAGGGAGGYSYPSWGVRRGTGGGGSSYVASGIGITVTENSQGTNAAAGYITIVNTSIPSTIISYSGSYSTFPITTAGRYKIELFGAGGYNNGGAGGYTSGTISLTTSDVLYIYAGGKNGYNGGGLGYTGMSSYSGGGETDVRLNSTSLADRIMVAGGGGGGGGYYVGGSGGNLTAGTGDGYSYTSGANHHYMGGGGGNQATGGYTGYYVNNHTWFTVVGLFFQGAAGLGMESNNCDVYSGAGGGGWYGGGNGEVVSFTDNSCHVGAGGGGSSYISGYTGCVAITSASNTNPKAGCTDGTTDNSCSIHYSGRYFTDTAMVSGANADNGYARITYLGA